MSLLDIAYVPAVQVMPTDSVRHAITAALPTKCDAVAVTENERIIGILTLHDIIQRVVIGGRGADDTRVSDVMTSPVITVGPEELPEKVLTMMLEGDFRHIPISADGQSAMGMLSLRKVMLHILENQQDNLTSLEAYINVDGWGG